MSDTVPEAHVYCPGCAHNNIEGVTICAACGANMPIGSAGYPQTPYGYGGYNQGYIPPPAYAPRRTSGMAIAGFVLSFFCSILGLIFSILGYNECKRSNGAIEGQGLALAGIIISVVSLAIGLFYVIFVAAMVGSHGY